MPEQTPPDQPTDPNGEAWIDAEGAVDTPQPMPPGVVYRTPGEQRYGDVNEQLTSHEPVWPFEDPTEIGVPPPRSSLPPFLIGLILGIGLAGVSILGFGLFRRDADPAAAGTTTTTSTVTTVTTTTAPVTTTTATATTTQPADTTTTTNAGFIEAVGNPIPTSNLQLVDNGIGPFDFGQDADEVLGGFVASFGQPNSDTGITTSVGEMGSCEGDSIRVVRWGPLALLAIYQGNAGTFQGYRLDVSFGDIDSPTTEVRTLSGIGVTDTIATLEEVYASFTINYVVEDGLGQVFELRRSADSGLLLWGPVSSADPEGIVTGIYSTNPCDR